MQSLATSFVGAILAADWHDVKINTGFEGANWIIITIGIILGVAFLIGLAGVAWGIGKLAFGAFRGREVGIGDAAYSIGLGAAAMVIAGSFLGVISFVLRTYS